MYFVQVKEPWLKLQPLLIELLQYVESFVQNSNVLLIAFYVSCIIIVVLSAVVKNHCETLKSKTDYSRHVSRGGQVPLQSFCQRLLPKCEPATNK